MIERRQVGPAQPKQPDPETRPRARAAGPHEELRRFQRAVGNAGIARLLGPPRRTLARFGEPEHKAVGDAALDTRWRLPGSTLYKELEMSFGDWVSLGDWFEDLAQVKEFLRPGRGPEQVGQVYYALLVKVRPTTKEERDKAETDYMGKLFTAKDKAAVEKRYTDLKTRNIKHFPNPLAGDTALSTAEKAKRRRDGKPFGAIAQYHSDHVDAINLAISAGQLDRESLLGEALAIDGFGCHFLTDAFSASHTRTPRSSIETHWDKKVPDFVGRLVKWLADEVAYAVDKSPSGVLEWLGVTVGAPFDLVRSKARDKIRKVVPALSFGDIVGLVVHDWEGAHGKDGHGPLVEIGGQRFHTVGDDRLLPAAASLKGLKSESQFKGVLKDKRRSAAERTFAGATLAVKASVSDVQRAFELAKKGRKRSSVIAALTGKDGLFASERLLPQVVPDAAQPEEDRMPKWDYATVDGLLANTKIQAALPESAARVAEPFEETVKTLDASKAVKEQLRAAVITPLTSGHVPTIIGWLKGVIDYSPKRLRARMRRERQTTGDVFDVLETIH